MAVRKPVYGTAAAVNITLASLAASATLVAGRQSDVIDNTATPQLDYQLSAAVSTGTTPTVGVIEVWVVAERDDAGTSHWPDTFTAADAAKTVTSRDMLTAYGRLAGSATTDTTTNRTYVPCNNVSVASLFGGVCPTKFVVFVVHSTGVALMSTAGGHLVTVKGYREDIS